MQQDVESPTAEGAPQGSQPREAVTLVDGDKLDLGNEAHQPRFDAADDPREPGRGPGTLQSAQHRHHVAGVTDRGEPQQAHVFGRLVERQHGSIRREGEDAR